MCSSPPSHFPGGSPRPQTGFPNGAAGWMMVGGSWIWPGWCKEHQGIYQYLKRTNISLTIWKWMVGKLTFPLKMAYLADFWSVSFRDCGTPGFFPARNGLGRGFCQPNHKIIQNLWFVDHLVTVYILVNTKIFIFRRATNVQQMKHRREKLVDHGSGQHPSEWSRDFTEVLCHCQQRAVESALVGDLVLWGRFLEAWKCNVWIATPKIFPRKLQISSDVIDLEIWVSFFESSCTSIYSVSVEVTPRRFQDLLNSFGGLVVGDLLYMCLYSISRQSIYTYICIFKSIYLYIYIYIHWIWIARKFPCKCENSSITLVAWMIWMWFKRIVRSGAAALLNINQLVSLPHPVLVASNLKFSRHFRIWIQHMFTVRNKAANSSLSHQKRT